MKKLNATYCTTTQLAEFVGRSTRRIQQMVKAGQLPKPDDKGRMKTWAVIGAYIKTLQDALKTGGSDDAGITASRSRYEKARAEEKELEVAKLKSEVVLTDDVKDQWLNMVGNFRARMLTLPSTLAAQGEGLDRIELQKIADKLVHKALKELSENADSTDN